MFSKEVPDLYDFEKIIKALEKNTELKSTKKAIVHAKTKQFNIVEKFCPFPSFVSENELIKEKWVMAIKMYNPNQRFALKNPESNIVYFDEDDLKLHSYCSQVYNYINKASKQGKTKLKVYSIGWQLCLDYASKNINDLNHLLLDKI